MKICLFGLTITSSWGNGHATPYRAVLGALARRGHRIVFYEKDVEYYRLRRDFASCDFCEVRLYDRWENIFRQALRDAADADVTINASYCPEGARIADDVLALEGPLHVFYDLDTPVTLRVLRSGALDYLRQEQIPEFDLYLSWTGGESLRELEEQWGARMARPLYGCVDPAAYQRVAPRADYGCDLSYMGTYAPDRQEKLDDLLLEPSRRMPEKQFVVAGSLYPWEWQWGANVRRFDHVAPAEHPAFYSSSRATLNITREDMARVGYCPSPRLFEAAACGCVVVSDRWNGLDHFFRDQEEIFVVRDAEAVQEVLALPDGELSRVAARARERTLSEHTGEQRADSLLQSIEEAGTRSARRAQEEAA